MKKLLRSLLISTMFCLGSSAFADDSMSVKYSVNKNYTFTEKTDLRRYDNSKYTGLFSNEVRSFITCKPAEEKSVSCSGIFYVLQQTKRNMNDARKGFNEAIQADFKIGQNGTLEMVNDNGYPTFRNFPSLPESKVVPGDSWTGTSLRCVDISGNQKFTLLPMLVSYSYLRKDKWYGQDVYVVSAKWATRFNPAVNIEEDLEFDSDLRGATGSHVATLYISCESGAMLYCRDIVDETFSYKNGTSVAYKGTINLFTDYAAVVDRKNVTSSVKTSFDDTDFKGEVSVKESDSGLVLVLNNLRFEPDSSILLPGETQRLDLIADVLKKSPDSVFLVCGHAASTGNPNGEKTVSEDRARAIAQALADRGIKSENIVCRGAGSSEPVASNDTPEGRSLNRRVEITILE